MKKKDRSCEDINWRICPDLRKIKAVSVVPLDVEDYHDVSVILSLIVYLFYWQGPSQNRGSLLPKMHRVLRLKQENTEDKSHQGEPVKKGEKKHELPQ